MGRPGFESDARASIISPYIILFPGGSDLLSQKSNSILDYTDSIMTSMSRKIRVSVFSAGNIFAAGLLVREPARRQTGPGTPSTPFASVLEEEEGAQGACPRGPGLRPVSLWNSTYWLFCLPYPQLTLFC